MSETTDRFMQYVRARAKGLHVAVALMALASPVASHATEPTVKEGVSQGMYNYYDLVKTAYGVSLDHVLDLKAQYRAAHPNVEIITDYTKVHNPVEIRKVEVGRYKHGILSSKSNNSMSAIAGYLPAEHLILVSDNDTPTWEHEVGHSMQAEDKLNVVDPKMSLDPFLKDMINNWTVPYEGRDEFWTSDYMGYMLSQPELEVRMAALNRYMFTEHHELILSPKDALRALAAIDSAPSYNQASRILAKHGETLTREAYNKLVDIPKTSIKKLRKTDQMNVADIADAIYNMQLSGIDDKYYEKLMDKLLQEIPAHAQYNAPMKSIGNPVMDVGTVQSMGDMS